MARPFGTFTGSIRALIVFGALVCGAGDLCAEPLLFPAPLHLTRQIEDPFASSPVVIDEYCSGNRIVAVRGDRVAITDYAKGEVVEIDRIANTFSRTPFEVIARTRAANAARHPKNGEWVAVPAPGRTIASTAAEAFTIRAPEGSGVRTIEVAVDPQRRVSREAFDVLTGAAFPNSPRAGHDAIVRVASRNRLQPTTVQSDDTRSLLLEERITFESGGETIVTRNAIVAIDSAVAPEHLLAPLPGAKEVESPIVAREKLLRELDQLPSAPASQP